MSPEQTVVSNPAEALIDEVKPDSQGKYPETVPWSQYVRTKETIGNKLNTERERVKALEEQLKTAVKPEDLKKVQDELNQAKADKQKTADELKAIKDSSISEKKAILVKQGIPEAEVKDMSEDALNAAVKVMGYSKPGMPRPDMGAGGGAGELKGSPMELARQAYSKSNK